MSPRCTAGDPVADQSCNTARSRGADAGGADVDLQGVVDCVVDGVQAQMTRELLGAEYVAVVTAFVADVRMKCMALAQAAIASDHVGLRSLAHSVKGAARNLGATALAARAAALEARATAGGLWPEPGDADWLQAFRACVDATEKALLEPPGPRVPVLASGLAGETWRADGCGKAKRRDTGPAGGAAGVVDDQ